MKPSEKPSTHKPSDAAKGDKHHSAKKSARPGPSPSKEKKAGRAESAQPKRSSSKANAKAKSEQTGRPGGHRAQHEVVAKRSMEKPTSPIDQPAAGSRNRDSKRIPESKLKQRDSIRRPSAMQRSQRKRTAGQDVTKGQGLGSHEEKEDTSVAENRKRWRAAGTSLVIALCITVAIVGASFLVVSFLRHGASVERKSGLGAGLTLMATLRDSCESEGCRKAIAALNDSLNPTATPCSNLYEYVCGKWSARENVSGSTVSYRDLLRRNYAQAVQQRFHNASSNPCSSHQEVHKVACVYASCLAFLIGGEFTVSRLWVAAGMNSTEWMAATTFSELFILMVRANLDSTLKSVFHIRREGHNTAVIYPGTCMACNKLTKELLRTSMSPFVKVNFNLERLVTSVWSLDSRFTRIEGKEGTVKDVTAADISLPSKGLSWTTALSRHRYFNGSAGRIRLKSSNSITVQYILKVLGDADPDVVRAYTMLLPFAKFIFANHELGIDAGRLDNVSKYSICANNVNLLFETTFQKIMTILQDEKAIVEARNMWADIQIQASKSLTIAPGMQLDKAALQAAKMKAYGAHDSAATNDTVFAPQYGKDFISNLIMYNRQTKDDLDFDAHLKVTVEDLDIIPTAFLIPDFYYAGATEPSINFATLGTHIAMMLFNQSFPKVSSAQHRKTADCLKNYAHRWLNLDLVGEEWITYLRAKWSLETSHRVALSGRKDILERLLFLRFARMYCGEDRKRVGRMMFALLTSKFAEAFGCPKAAQFSC